MPRILVAENDASLLHLTAELLGDHAQVDTASTAAEALRLIPLNEYDVLITDLNLDRGGEGLVLAGAMRSLHPQARNVMATRISPAPSGPFSRHWTRFTSSRWNRRRCAA